MKQSFIYIKKIHCSKHNYANKLAKSKNASAVNENQPGAVHSVLLQFKTIGPTEDEVFQYQEKILATE